MCDIYNMRLTSLLAQTLLNVGDGSTRIEPGELSLQVTAALRSLPHISTYTMHTHLHLALRARGTMHCTAALGTALNHRVTPLRRRTLAVRTFVYIR